MSVLTTPRTHSSLDSRQSPLLCLQVYDKLRAMVQDNQGTFSGIELDTPGGPSYTSFLTS